MENNGNREKLNLPKDTPVRLKLLRDVYVGENSRGKYFLYVVQTADGNQWSWFAPVDAHDVLQVNGTKAGSEILVKRNGNKFEVSILGKPVETEKSANGRDSFKQLLQQSIEDAQEVVKACGLQVSNEELQKYVSTIFIARSKAY